MINIIAAVGKNNELGLNNELIWYLPKDLKFFKKMTINRTIVMGKNTFLSLKKVLPNRYNIVISRTLDSVSGAEIVNSFDEILKRFLNVDDDIYIIGGASIFNYFINYADKIYLTEINATNEADVFFPEFDRNLYEKVLLNEDKENDIEYKHVLYRRKIK